MYYEEFPDTRITIESPRADGESYGVGEERSLLLDLLQTPASMWSFSGCRFFEGDKDLLWYELKTGDANKKTPNVRLLLHFGWAKVVMAQDVEWVCCFFKGQNFPEA